MSSNIHPNCKPVAYTEFNVPNVKVELNTAKELSTQSIKSSEMATSYYTMAAETAADRELPRVRGPSNGGDLELPGVIRLGLPAWV